MLIANIFVKIALTENYLGYCQGDLTYLGVDETTYPYFNDAKAVGNVSCK